MIFSRRNMYCVYFMLIVMLAINLVSTDAKRLGGGGHHRTSVSRPPSRSPAHPPKSPVHPPSKPPTSFPKTQVYPPSKPPTSFPNPPVNTPSIRPPHSDTHGKDSSDIFLRGEGGGRQRPGSTGHDQKSPVPPHQPSAPLEPINKVTTNNVQNQAPNNGPWNQNGRYPPWANPTANQPSGSNPQILPPHGISVPGSPSNPAHQNQVKPSAPYPPTHPPGPILNQPMPPIHEHNQNIGPPHVIPVSNSNPHHYPNSGGHPQGLPPPPYIGNGPHGGVHPQGVPPPPYIDNGPHGGVHPQGVPPPPYNGNGVYGVVHQPAVGAPHNYPPGFSPPSTVIHNYYNGPPVGSPQNPAGHPLYSHPPVYGGGPIGQPFVPGQSVIVLPNQQSQNSGRGLGEMLKEAVVFSTVNAGVNRLINGPSHHHHHDTSSQPVAPAAPSPASTVTNTIIYNNQYGDPTAGTNGVPLQGQTGQPSPFPGSSVTYPPGGTNSGSNFPTGIPPNPNNIAAPNPSIGNPGNPSSPSGTQYTGSTGNPSFSHGTNNPPSNNTQIGTVGTTSVNNTANQPTPPVQEFLYFISNEVLWNLTENLFAKDEINATKYVTVDLQRRSVNENATDEASRRLLHVRDEAYALPTIQVMRDLYDNYQFDSEKKEMMDANKRRQENVMLDVFLNTDIMTTALNWLSARGYIEADDFEWKDTIRHMWMSRVNGATSGFERIFLAEKYPGSYVLGGQNWIYFDDQESLRRVKYMNYVDKVNLGDKATLVKINFKIDGVAKRNSTMLIGTPPELEMALYTICYYVRPNDECTVSLGGTKFKVYTHALRYFGKDLVDLGIMYF